MNILNILNIFNKFKKYNEKYDGKYNGLQLDTRPQSEKDKDWVAEEIFAAGSPVFRKVNELEWKKYQVRDQGGSASCVANTIAKMIEISHLMKTGKSVKFSHAPIYIKRANRPGGGMAGTDAFDIAVKTGTCLETDVPSENLSDYQLDLIELPANYEDLNNLVMPDNYFVVKNLNFDYVASLVNQTGAVMYWVDTTFDAFNKTIPVASGKEGFRHSVTMIECIKYEGVDYILIEDSYFISSSKYTGQRLINREQFNSNGIFAAVFTTLKYDVVDVLDAKDTKPVKPSVKPVKSPVKTNTFNIVMKLNDRFAEVKRLQDFLKVQGLFPSNIKSTGFYGPLTAKGVYAFQVRHAVDTLDVLDQLKGRRVGLKTLNKINELIK